MKRTIVFVVAACLLIAFAVFEFYSGKESKATATTNPADALEKPKEGYMAPAFTLQGLDERPYSIGGSRGKLLIVNFWASWCAPCEMEAPDLEALYKQYGDQVDLYGVNSTAFDRERDAREFVDAQKLSFPILMDRAGVATKLYKVDNFPTSLIIDPSGKVLERINGIITRKEWESRIEGYL
ncbi:TlpA family protein disulfide reductase [Paenibacillus beijingensis]|uniref:Redoxin n=1 Tax=Paenibacillus beijingensis TaxID=1126833 RepID=A0A0D5NDY2_9BACL|nr:TlpA disulfide reductase family protein [Paenibacillus beijingensis]AJY73365.1 redoxin [Paenibacillus beijingensis]